MIDKVSLLEEMNIRIKKLQVMVEKFRKSKDGSQLHKTAARIDELKKWKRNIEDGLFDAEEEEL